MEKIKPYKEQEAAEQSVNEPMAVYNPEVALRRMSVEIPPKDVAFFKELVKKMGWNMVVGTPSSAKKENVSKREVINQLFGSVRLPEDFDYKKELEDALRAKYL